MALPAYQVAVLSPVDGSVVLMLDASAFYNLRYSLALNDVGLLAMTLPSTAAIRAAFVLDAFIEVYRADVAGVLQKEETYLCRYTQRFIEGDEERFVVGGLALNHLLMRRIIDPVGSTDGYVAYNGAADTVIYNYCLFQVGVAAAEIARRTPNLIILVPMGIGGTVSARLRYQNLFNEVQKLARQGAVDFFIARTTASNLEMTIGAIGTDRTYTTNAPLGRPYVALSPLRGNLTQPSLVRDRKTEANYAYALGQGQAEDRVLYTLALPEVTDSPFNRIEVYLDCRNVDIADAATLASQAVSGLNERRFVQAFTFKPTGAEPGNVYHIDWELGDAVTVSWEEFSDDFRITDVQISISRDGESIQATVSDDYVFPGS